MLFQSPEFGLLFLGVLIAYYCFHRRFRIAIIAVASLVFYAASGLLDFALLIGTVGITYWLSIKVRPGVGKWPMALSIILLIGSLAYFKYGAFLDNNIAMLTANFGLSHYGIVGSPILPLGISFYTFQMVAYLVDRYRGRADAAPSFLHFLVFVIFFGQLVAGPIMRAREYLGQLTVLRGATMEDMRSGTFLILTGLVKKVVIADTLAKTVDVRFDTFTSLNSPETWVAAYLFAFQIYFDFSGYVDIALGLARMLGIKLKENFHTPYLSRSPREFWTRWHTTLSSWFRDYLYIPLGGNRKGKVRELANLMFVMVVAGLWHGAAWNFVIWGAVHGTYLLISRMVPSRWVLVWKIGRTRHLSHAFNVLAVFFFFHLTVLAWIPFRAPDLATAYSMIQRIVQLDGLSAWMSEVRWLALVWFLFCLHILERLSRERYIVTMRCWHLIPSLVRGAIYAIVVLLIVVSSVGEQNFIYFRF